MASNLTWTWIAAALALASCSKEKPAEPSSAPPESTSSAVASAEPAANSAPSAPAPQATGPLRARFDGYTPRIAGSLWQTVPLTAQPAQFALLVPTAPLTDSLAGLKADGPENVALATEGLLQDATGRPLVVGREYDFAFSQDGTVWKAEIQRRP